MSSCGPCPSHDERWRRIFRPYAASKEAGVEASRSQAGKLSPPGRIWRRKSSSNSAFLGCAATVSLTEWSRQKLDAGRAKRARSMRVAASSSMLRASQCRRWHSGWARRFPFWLCWMHAPQTAKRVATNRNRPHNHAGWRPSAKFSLKEFAGKGL